MIWTFFCEQFHQPIWKNCIAIILFCLKPNSGSYARTYTINHIYYRNYLSCFKKMISKVTKSPKDNHYCYHSKFQLSRKTCSANKMLQKRTIIEKMFNCQSMFWISMKTSIHETKVHVLKLVYKEDLIWKWKIYTSL